LLGRYTSDNTDPRSDLVASYCDTWHEGKRTMRPVTWKELQYRREQELYARLRPILDRLRRDYGAFAERTNQHEREFLSYLSHSVKIDALADVVELVQRLNERLHTTLKVNIFLFQSPVANALCVPRYGCHTNGNNQELVILVSQHFLNELGPAEKLIVLGHELGHLLFGHVHIPAKALLQSNFPLKDIQAVKSDVLKWMICSEVSCDLLAYVSGGCDAEAFSLTMLKYSTGLTSRAVSSHDQQRQLIDTVLQQCEEIGAASLDATLSTHPLTPLRLKIVKAASDSALVRHLGTSLAPGDMVTYQSELNRLIDAEVGKIYPEIVPIRQDGRGQTLLGGLFELCIAVALSDGKITQEEVAAVQKIVGGRHTVQPYYERLAARLKTTSPGSIVRDIVGRAVREAKQGNCRKSHIIPVVRCLLTVAASDGTVERRELDTIYGFACEFGMSKQEILVVLAQMGLLHGQYQTGGSYDVFARMV